MTWFLDKAFLEGLELGGYDAMAIAKRLDMPVDIVARFVDPARLYTVLTNDEYGWLAGVAGEDNERPALVFLGAPRLSGGEQAPINAIVFEADGSIRTKAIACADDVMADGEALLDLLYDELEFEHTGTATVRAFKHPELWHYALVPLPAHMHELAVGTEQDADALPDVRGWIEDGSFVVHCGNAYWLSADGEVTSS